MRRSLLAFALVILALTDSAQGQDRAMAIGAGSSEQSVELPAATLRLFTYRPVGCAPHLLLLVFHGATRDAATYRDQARPLADRLCAAVVAPWFDKIRFPRELYQYGGIARNGALAQADTRTVDLIPPLADRVRIALGSPRMPYVLLGHSAGGQFVDRIAAFAKTDAARIIVANPSTWVMPSVTVPAPFGFGNTGSEKESEQALRAYLERPVIVLLGDADTETTHNLAMSPEAMAQGPNRLARGRNVFKGAQATARQRAWAFNWRLVEVPGVGHDAAAMFSAPQTAAALEDLRGSRP